MTSGRVEGCHRSRRPCRGSESQQEAQRGLDAVGSAWQDCWTGLARLLRISQRNIATTGGPCFVPSFGEGGVCLFRRSSSFNMAVPSWDERQACGPGSRRMPAARFDGKCGGSEVGPVDTSDKTGKKVEVNLFHHWFFGTGFKLSLVSQNGAPPWRRCGGPLSRLFLACLCRGCRPESHRAGKPDLWATGEGRIHLIEQPFN